MASDYLFPMSVEEAVSTLARAGGGARIIAGGTDLMVQVKEGRREVDTFVDITRIPELHGIREQDGFIWLGSTTTHREIWSSELIQARAPVLAEACHRLGALQVQSVGTIGGNVINAMPGADGSIALTALSAEVEVVTPEGRRWLPLAEVFTRPGICKIEPTAELAVAFRFRPLGERAGSAYERLARRKGLAMPVMACAAVVQLDAAGEAFEWAAISLGPVAQTPLRAADAEALLAGAPISDAAIEAAAAAAGAASHPRSNPLRAGAEYRRAMVPVLMRRALVRAVDAARQ